jgi:hypothetical protein
MFFLTHHVFISPNNLPMVIQEETRWTLAGNFNPGWNVLKQKKLFFISPFQLKASQMAKEWC